MNKPTEAQQVELWEWCGFKFQDYIPSFGNIKEVKEAWIYPDGSKHSDLPNLNGIEALGNLFKYTVPKIAMPVMLSTYLGETEAILPAYFPDEEDLMSEPLSVKNNDPALALFWAIYEAFGLGR